MTLEPLECRRLLFGMTLITHGYNGDVNGWVATAAGDVEARVGGVDAASIYTMSVTAAKNGKLSVSAFAADDGQKDYRQTTAGELIVKLDWSTVSGGGYTTQAVAQAVDDYITAFHGREHPLAEMPMHLIGHSRGASLVSALSQDLGRAGVWVDQVTYLDPHPVDGKNDFYGVSFGDQKMAVYDNTAFADDYWRTDGNPNNSDFDGEPVTGTYQGNLNDSVQKDFFVSAHIAVPAYYIGTIDTKTSDGGDHPVLSDWYGKTADKPARTQTGYIFSRLGGHSRPSSGESTLLGGRAKRTAVDADGSQYSNVFNFVSRGSTTYSAGQSIRTQFLVADKDSRSQVQVYIDQDANPYDGASMITSKSFAATSLAAGKLYVGTTGLKAGTYYLAAKATDADGHERWSYSPLQIKIVNPNFATESGGVITVTGTSDDDRLVMDQEHGNYTFTLNGATQTFSTSGVTAVNVDGGAGNDSILGAGMETGFYAFGGDGADSILGGTGNDTLRGGAQNDTLTGNTGDDNLNGGGGRNLVVGNGGYNRLYSTDGAQDTLVGGGNADRFFGGSGDDSMIGGGGNDKMYGNAGNDTLIGGAGADILNGGPGSNTADTDPLDLRTDIQILL